MMTHLPIARINNNLMRVAIKRGEDCAARVYCLCVPLARGGKVSYEAIRDLCALWGICKERTLRKHLKNKTFFKCRTKKGDIILNGQELIARKIYRTYIGDYADVPVTDIISLADFRAVVMAIDMAQSPEPTPFHEPVARQTRGGWYNKTGRTIQRWIARCRYNIYCQHNALVSCQPYHTPTPEEARRGIYNIKVLDEFGQRQPQMRRRLPNSEWSELYVVETAAARRTKREYSRRPPGDAEGATQRSRYLPADAGNGHALQKTYEMTPEGVCTFLHNPKRPVYDPTPWHSLLWSGQKRVRGCLWRI